MKKQKTLRTLLATLLLIAIMVMSLPVFAAAPTGSIELTNIEKAATVTIYKLADFNYNEAASQPTFPTYKWVSGVNTWLESSDYATYVNTEAAGAEEFSKIASDSDVAKAVYGAITAAIRNGSATVSPLSVDESNVSRVDGGENRETRTISNLDMGTYLIVIESANRIYQPVVRNVGMKSTESGWVVDSEAAKASVDAKSAEVTITKSADKTQVKTGGERVKYTIEADVPAYPASAISTKYAISDKVPSVMKMMNGTIKVFGLNDGVEPDELTTGFTNKTPDGEYTFTLDFTYDTIKTYKKVRVTYETILSATTGTDVNTAYKNTAYLDYSNNPYVENSSKVEETTDDPGVKTYGFKLNKTDGNNPLPGAEFSVKATEDGADLKFTKVADGIYYHSNSGTETSLAVNESGVLEVRGLTTGTYYYQETKAPADYNKLPDVKSITVTATDSVSAEVVNKKGFQLPVTGGMGTVIFTVAGIAFIVVGAAIVIGKKRGSKN